MLKIYGANKANYNHLPTQHLTKKCYLPYPCAANR